MAASNPEVTDDIRTSIVQALACFDTPTAVAEAVKQEFGIVVTPQAVQAYDPTKYAGRNVAAKWRELFDATRKAFIEDAAQVPIAHRSTRLRALYRMAQTAEKKGNFPLAAQLHKQAAEEMGNAYTNKRELSGPNGKDLPSSAPSVAVFALPDNGRG
jgi:hypothetical protein